ncbi:MAG: alpha/beta fold hydrolase, partial [Caulobacterales bacterium]|nr:alpha/beta fold hydrolase [Caulobacterales bacterium]
MAEPSHDRGVVFVDGRAVHYRRAGTGPVVVALHGSPESAKALTPLIAALAGRFTVIALDTPGNGDSDPLPQSEPDTDDFARALIATLDALGLGRVGLYGFHTGAGVAIQTALHAPERITAVTLDGYAVWTEEERAVFLSPDYLTPFTPRADGAHLTALWSRIEEQSVFFPYFAQSEAARLDMDVTALEDRQRRALDWLKAGDAYRGPYRAAFQRRGEE